MNFLLKSLVYSYLGAGTLFSSVVGLCNGYNGVQLFEYRETLLRCTDGLQKTEQYLTANKQILSIDAQGAIVDCFKDASHPTPVDWKAQARYYGTLGAWAAGGSAAVASKMSVYTFVWPLVLWDIQRKGMASDNHFCPGRRCFDQRRSYELLKAQGKLLLPFTRLH